MKTLIKAALAIAVAAAAALLWIERPTRTLQAFASHMTSGAYGEASSMLRAPSALDAGADGTLTLVDRAGAMTSVPAAKLPFKVGGRDSAKFPGATAMTALGPSTNGVLKTPAVTLYLSVDGGKVQIEGVEQ